MAKKPEAILPANVKQDKSKGKKAHPSVDSTAKTIQARKNLNKKVMEELDL